jgi:hypothetical protein
VSVICEVCDYDLCSKCAGLSLYDEDSNATYSDKHPEPDDSRESDLISQGAIDEATDWIKKNEEFPHGALTCGR